MFTKHDFLKIFSKDQPKALEKGLRRLLKEDILKHAYRGVYVNETAQSFNSYVIKYVAKALGRGEYNYVSLESILSEYGLISQIPIDRITIMTTGQKGNYKTIYRTIEFTHTNRSRKNILDNIISMPGRSLRIATKKAAIRDLKRVGRNVNLLNLEELKDD